MASGLGAFLQGAVGGYGVGRDLRDKHNARKASARVSGAASTAAQQGLSMTGQVQAMADAHMQNGDVEKALKFKEYAQGMAKEGYLQALDGALAGEDAEAIKKQFNASGKMRLKDLRVEPYEMDIPGMGKVRTAKLFGTTEDGRPFAMDDVYGARVRALTFAEQLDIRDKRLDRQLKQQEAGAKLKESAARVNESKAKVKQTEVGTEKTRQQIERDKQLLPHDTKKAEMANTVAKLGIDKAQRDYQWAGEDRGTDKAMQQADLNYKRHRATNEKNKPLSRSSGGGSGDAGKPSFYDKERYKALAKEAGKLREMAVTGVDATGLNPLDDAAKAEIETRLGVLGREMRALSGGGANVSSASGPPSAPPPEPVGDLTAAELEELEALRLSQQ